MYFAIEVVLNYLLKSLPYLLHHWKPGICKYFLFYGVIIGCYALHKILLQDFSIHWLIHKMFGILIFFFQNSKDQNKVKKEHKGISKLIIYSKWEFAVFFSTKVD